MKLIKVAAGVLNQTPLDWEANRDNILQTIQLAKKKQVSVLCLPEMCISGYGCEDAFYSTGTLATAAEMLKSVIPETKGIAVSVGLPLMYAGGIFNVACFLVDGNVAGFVAKQHLAGDGIHYEPRWFKAWPDRVQSMVDFSDGEFPIGDILFDLKGVRIGFEICEDAWVGTRPGARHAERGADIILNPSASHFAFGKHETRRRFVIEGSRAFNVTYVFSNLVGNESGRAIYDGDALIAASGELVAAGPRLFYQPHSLTSCVIDIDKTRMNRARTGSFEPEIDGDESDVIDVDFAIPVAKATADVCAEPNWEQSSYLKCEEFTRAVSLGLFDYMRKSRSNGFVVSLSGGADSTSAAVLVTTAFRLAEQEIGLDGLLALLRSFVPIPEEIDSIDHLIARVLTTAYQSTDNSGPITRNAAKKTAQAIYATHHELDVQPMVDNYLNAIGDALGIEFNWEQHDIALQNIQSRTRSPGIWMIANLQNALLLSTSNRSESAVGYATMDGDTSGGLSPLAGIDKAFLLTWLKWMQDKGPEGLGPIPELQLVNEQQPTAELRPTDFGQTDEDDLMPYHVLDQIERLAIRDKKMPVEVFEKINVVFSEYSPQQLGNWTVKFFRLWSQNQWKRERYAPSFHLDDENLDPKTWCRFPVLSGGYQFEISKLQSLLNSLSE